MIYKTINDMKVSAVAIGADYYGTSVSEKDSFRLMDIYTDFGGNCIDTARLYANGMSEEVVGRWLKGKSRDKIVVSTKGAHPPIEDMSRSRLSEEELRYDLELSLKKLDCDYIDLYWLHRDDAEKPVGPIIESLNKFIKEGKIRNIGASNWTVKRIAEANKYAEENGLKPFCASQIKWSLVKTNGDYQDDPTIVEMNEEEYEFYKKKSTAVFAYASQGKGFFSKLIKGGADSLDDKTRERYLCESNLKNSELILSIAEKNNISISAAVVSYIYSDENTNSIALIGPKNEAQLMDTIKYADFVMSKEDRQMFK